MAFYTSQTSLREIIKGRQAEILKPFEIVLLKFFNSSQQAAFKYSSIFILVRIILAPSFGKVFVHFLKKLSYIFPAETGLSPINGFIPVFGGCAYEFLEPGRPFMLGIITVLLAVPF